MNTIVNLQENPELLSPTVKLIEESFGYTPKQSFQVDFAPLMHPSNLHNCFAYLHQNQLVAHIGCLPRQTMNPQLELVLLGGIAVAPSMRGKGIFKALLNHCLQQFSNASAIMLWSDLHQLYAHFDFYPCFEYFEYQQNQPQKQQFECTHYQNLKKSEQEQIQQLYQQKVQNHFSIHRQQKHWDILSTITSAQWWIRRNPKNEIIGYAVRGKGMDLTNIIHEYSWPAEFIYELSQLGILWSANHYPQLQKNPHKQIGALVKVLDSKLTFDFLNQQSFYFSGLDSI